MKKLSGRTYFISGASRGIGRAMALRLAGEGANIVIAAKSDTAHETLEGTIHETARAVEQAGGHALALKVDVRQAEEVKAAMDQAASHFGGLHGVVNNASAIHLLPTDKMEEKRYDLMMDVNMRGTFFCVQAALPYLKQAENAHILTMAPPVNMASQVLGVSPAYTASKYGMAVLTLSFAQEFAKYGISANTLWPATLIDTAAVRVHFSGFSQASRTASIVADAAYEILCGPERRTGQSLIDEDVLRASGVTDFSTYRTSEEEPQEDFFLDGYPRTGN